MTLLPLWLWATPIMQALPVLCLALALCLIPLLGRP
jgi:hypothetical protein